MVHFTVFTWGDGEVYFWAAGREREGSVRVQQWIEYTLGLPAFIVSEAG